MLGVLCLGPGLSAAQAGKKKHHHHHGYNRGPRVSVGYYGPGYYTPYGYPRYYGPAPVYYAPQPVVISRPIVVSRPVVVEREVVYAAPVAGRGVESEVQRALAKRGYYGGSIDGAIGSQTRAAIRAYQVDKGLPVTGRIDGNLLRSLRLL